MSERLEERVARVEGILEQMDKRLSRVEAELKELRQEISAEIRELRSEMMAGFQRLDDRFYSLVKWIIVALASMWGTLMAAILALFFKG
ncbi:hypothetical protein DRP77_09575 [Candidatus Poribacteria bacterium]|nr:MAG: hypothetical protein DRP77_09575 [Candidatus Poribacteria bacterium]